MSKWRALPTLLFTALLVAAPGSGSAGGGTHERPDVDATDWRWQPVEPPPPAGPLDGETREALDALGYLRAHTEASGRSGVVVHDPARAQAGYNLASAGHAPQATLMDMSGRVLHVWRHSGIPTYGLPPHLDFFRRVELLPDGSLLAIFDPYGVVKLDRESNLVWASDADVLAHHDLSALPDGRILVLGKIPRVDPSLHPTRTLLEDQIVVLDRDGKTLERFSLRSAFEGTPHWDAMRKRIARHVADWPRDFPEDFHANTIQVLDGSLAERSPLLAAGNLVFCSPLHKNVTIVDGQTRKVIWNWFARLPGGIHESTFVASGNLLLFDNGPYTPEPTGRERSRVLEFDPFGKGLAWRYEGDPQRPETRFYSATASTVARLANGNTLLVASERGRAIEVSRDGRVVWEYFVPERSGPNGELIAALFQLDRVAAGDVPWLEP